MKFNTNMLKEWDLPYSALEDRITGTSRWSTKHEIIFQFNDKFYRTSYQTGATEMQDEQPWEYQKEVECEEVQRVEKLVTIWEPVIE